MTSPDELNRLRQSMEESLDRLERLMLAFTGVVVIGLVIEYYPSLSEFLQTHDWRTLLKSVGGLFVTIGVAGELFVSFKAHRVERQLRVVNSVIDRDAKEALRMADERIARASKQAADADRTLNLLRNIRVR